MGEKKWGKRRGRESRAADKGDSSGFAEFSVQVIPLVPPSSHKRVPLSAHAQLTAKTKKSRPALWQDGISFNLAGSCHNRC